MRDAHHREQFSAVAPRTSQPCGPRFPPRLISLRLLRRLPRNAQITKPTPQSATGMPTAAATGTIDGAGNGRSIADRAVTASLASREKNFTVTLLTFSR